MRFLAKALMWETVKGDFRLVVTALDGEFQDFLTE